MKLKLTFFLLLLPFLGLVAASNSPFELRLNLSPNSIFKLEGSIRIDAYLVNKSNENHIVSKSRLPHFNIMHTDWNFKIDDETIKYVPFRDRLTETYNKKRNINLAPGDSVLVAIFSTSLKKEGLYNISCKHSQMKSRANPNFVKSKFIKDNTDFEVTSKEYAFRYKIPEFTGEVLPMSKEQIYKYPSLDWTTAIMNPNEAYILNLKSLEKDQYKYLKNLKNIRVLTINSIDKDIVALPDFFKDLHLISLKIYLKKSELKELQFPEGMCASNTLEDIYIFNVHLSKLPDWLYNQKNIKKIELRKTGLMDIDDAIGNLQELTDFIVWEGTPDKLKALPQTFSKLKNLQHLNLENCEITDITPLEGLADYNQLKSFKFATTGSFSKDDPILNKLNKSGTRIHFFGKNEAFSLPVPPQP